MEFKTISRFHFSPIEKDMRSQDETFRIGENMVHMTKALFARMNNPEHLLFAYDAEERAVGVKIVEDNEPNSIDVIHNDKHTYMKNSKYICTKIADVMKVDLTKKCIILRRGYHIDDWYVFELKYADIINRSGRKKVSDES